MRKKRASGLLRPLVFAVAIGLHAVLLYFVAFHVETNTEKPEPRAKVMKLLDVEEYTPPPPPPPKTPPPEIVSTTTEPVAETVIETDEVPDEIGVPMPAQQSEVIEFLSMSKISKLPVLPESEIRAAVVYPPIALRSGVEGTVYLELFIDREGTIRDIKVLRENPEGRGFAQAAVNAIESIRTRGLHIEPAESNGGPVAVRYRYPVKFTIK